MLPRSRCAHGTWLLYNHKRLLATDISAHALMKNVAKCDTWYELQNPVNHRVFERMLGLKPFGRGHVCLGVTHRVTPNKSLLGADIGLPDARMLLLSRATESRAPSRHFCLPTLETTQSEVPPRSVVPITASGLQGEHLGRWNNVGKGGGEVGKMVRNLGKRIGLRAGHGGPSLNVGVGGLLECSAARAGVAAVAGRGGLGNGSLGGLPGRRTATQNWYGQGEFRLSECQSEGNIQPSRRNHSQGTGLAESAGKEDPVSLSLVDLCEMTCEGSITGSLGRKLASAGRSGRKTLSGGEFGWGGTSVKR
ncbi:hypothetical protein Tco_1345651 [Tanacetum coccineum]